MFGNIFKEATGILDRRFLINVFFPSLIFWGLLVAVFLTGQGNILEYINSWNQQPGTSQFLQIITFISLATILSIFLDSQLIKILRFYEGYNWNFPLSKFLKEYGQKYHIKRHQDLCNQVNKHYKEIYELYPQDSGKIMPTRLGNILRNSESYAWERYRIDAILIWPLLYNFFPERFIQTIAATKSSMDIMLVLSFLSGSFAILSGIYLIIVGGSWCLFLLCFWGGLFVAKIAYQGMVDSAIVYGRQIKVAFDLYRNDLLKQLRIPLPETSEEEMEIWSKLCWFLWSISDKNLSYGNRQQSDSRN